MKLKVELPYDPAIPLLSIYTKETKSLSHRDICTLMFTAALFTIAKVFGNILRKDKCVSVDEWIKKMWYRYTMQYYSV